MPYASNTTVAVTKSRDDIEKMLNKAGATAFGFASQGGKAMIAFEIAQRAVRIELPLPSIDRYQKDGKGNIRSAESPERRLLRTAWLTLQDCKGDFRNGVVSDGGLDEGEYHHHKMMDEIADVLGEARGHDARWRNYKGRAWCGELELTDDNLSTDALREVHVNGQRFVRERPPALAHAAEDHEGEIDAETKADIDRSMERSMTGVDPGPPQPPPVSAARLEELLTQTAALPADAYLIHVDKFENVPPYVARDELLSMSSELLASRAASKRGELAVAFLEARDAWMAAPDDSEEEGAAYAKFKVAETAWREAQQR